MFSSFPLLQRRRGTYSDGLPSRLADPFGFQMALENFTANTTGSPAEALADPWNIQMAQAVDTIALECPLPLDGAQLAPWYTTELRAIIRARRGA